MKKLQQFKIFAFTYERLKLSNFNIKITPFDAELKDELISIGDNECLRAIRRLTKHSFSEFKLNLLLEEKKNILKRANSIENKNRIKEINNELRNLIFIPQLISISSKKTKNYLKISESGFFVNGVHYIRFMCSAGHARTNRALFCDEKIFNELISVLRNGCKDIPLVGAKYNAYFALASSATYLVSTPRFCVVPDKEIKMIKTVDWVEEKDSIDEITRQDKELNFNLWDGMGIISPDFAQKWATELELDYLPSEFVCRAPFTKGMVCVFDFKDFSSKIAHTEIIKDIYGKEWNCNELDIILTESQFKLSKAFDSIDVFNKNMIERDLKWGVSKFSPKIEDKVKMTNYQFLQVLKCTDKDIEDICEYTLEWIKDVSCFNYEKTLLYLLGKLTRKYKSSEIFNNIGDSFIKALLIQPNLIGDSYILERILSSLDKRKSESCMGKLIFEGNFQFLVMDPYALCEHIFGLEVKGLLKEFEHYSNYWNINNNTEICALRSPMTWRSEINLLHLKNNEQTEYWYKYLKSGIVLNIWGCDNMLFSGADADGDCLFTTNNKTYIKCRDGGVPVTYQPKKADKINININELYKLDVLGFNTKIGYITNCSTTLYEMQTLFEENSLEYKEIENRLKLCCKYQSHEIDHAKGIQTKKFPVYFTSYQKIRDEDSCEKKIKKEFDNKIVVQKRAYFFKYRYPTYNQQYKNHVFDFDRYSITKYGCKFKELSEEFKQTDEYKELKSYYDYKNPLLETGGTMNRICYHMENSLKEIKKRNKRLKNTELIEILLDKNLEIDNIKLNTLKNIYDEYLSFKRNKMLSNSDFTTYEQFYKYIRNKSLEVVSSNIQELANLSVYLCYFMNKNKCFTWDVFGQGIVNNLINNKIMQNDTIISIPQLSEFGDIEYLGEKYEMMPYNLVDKKEDLTANYDYLMDTSWFEDENIINLEGKDDNI